MRSSWCCSSRGTASRGRDGRDLREAFLRRLPLVRLRLATATKRLSTPVRPALRPTIRPVSDEPRVLVVEDDGDIAGVLRRSLGMEGYDVRIAGDGEAALEQAAVFEPDAVVLDLGLPGIDGVEVSRRLREGGDVPILILTARESLDSRVEGLDSGADDYLVKPFEREELLARLRALLRRRPPRGSAFLVAGDLRLNPDTHEVFRGERGLDLTARELEAGGEPRLLHTVRGAGYVLRPET